MTDAELKWVEHLTGAHVSDVAELRSGVILCALMNKLLPDSARAKDSELAFVQRENIVSFLRAASRLGVADHELFETEDLFEERDIKLVYTTLRALSRVAHETNISVPVIGPALAQKHTPPPRPKNKPAMVGWNEHQYGTMRGATVSGSNLDSRRDVVPHFQRVTENNAGGLDIRDPSIPLFPDNSETNSKSKPKPKLKPKPNLYKK